jgi:hypothetical protein
MALTGHMERMKKRDRANITLDFWLFSYQCPMALAAHTEWMKMRRRPNLRSISGYFLISDLADGDD